MKKYDQLWPLVINEISLVGNIILTFINHKLANIRQIHDQFMGGINVIMT